MTLIATVPLLLIVGGLLAYLLSPNAKIAEIGKLCFFAGVLAVAFALSGHTVKLFG
jgi:Na+/phosphate symporter